MKRDSPILGFVIGLFLPFVGFIIMYSLWGHHQGLGLFARSLTFQPGLAAKVLTLSLLPNLIPFAYCNIKRIDGTMRGIFISTMLFVLLIVLIKFVW